MAISDGSDGTSTPQQAPEPEHDTVEDFLRDDMHLRTLTTLIQNLRNSAKVRVKHEFTDHPIPRKTKATCKWSFLLVRDSEVVAASPTKAANEIVITQTIPITDETKGKANPSDGDLESPLLTQKSRSNDPTISLWIVDPPKFQFNANWDSIKEVLRGTWNLNWEDHCHFVVHLLNMLLRASRSVSKPQLKKTAKAILLSYLVVSATAKNGRRLLERLATPKLTYYDMLFDFEISRHIQNFRYLDTKLPYLDTVLPPGTNTFMTSIFDDEDRRVLLHYALEVVGKTTLPAITRNFPLRYNFFDFLKDESKYREMELDQWMLQSVLAAFWELIKTLLVKVKRVSNEVRDRYPVGGGETPGSEDIVRINKDLYAAHKIMDYFLFRSRVLKWFINTIISTHLIHVFGSAEEESNDFLASEQHGQVGELFDDFQSDPVTGEGWFTDSGMETQSQLRKFWNWIHLSFSTFRYLDALIKELRPLPASDKIVLNIVATNQCTTQLKDWHEVLRELYPFDPDLKGKIIPKTAPKKPAGAPWTVVDTLRAQAKVEKEQSATGKPSWMMFWEHKSALLFKGQRHAGAILATIILLKKRREMGIDVFLLSEEDWAVLDSLGPIDNIVGPSKPCCPVCTQVLEGVSEALAEMGETRLAPPHSHSFIFGCAFPPFLPREIRQKVLSYFQEVLREVIGSLETRLRQQRAISPSALSEQSAAWTQSSIDTALSDSTNELALLTGHGSDTVLDAFRLFDD